MVITFKKDDIVLTRHPGLQLMIHMRSLRFIITCILQLEFLIKLVVVKGIVCITTLASLTIKYNCAELQFRQGKIK